MIYIFCFGISAGVSKHTNTAWLVGQLDTDNGTISTTGKEFALFS